MEIIYKQEKNIMFIGDMIEYKDNSLIISSGSLPKRELKIELVSIIYEGNQYYDIKEFIDKLTTTIKPEMVRFSDYNYTKHLQCDISYAPIKVLPRMKVSITKVDDDGNRFKRIMRINDILRIKDESIIEIFDDNNPDYTGYESLQCIGDMFFKTHDTYNRSLEFHLTNLEEFIFYINSHLESGKPIEVNIEVNLSQNFTSIKLVGRQLQSFPMKEDIKENVKKSLDHYKNMIKSLRPKKYKNKIK